jgi:hypothetical protein
MLDEEQLQKIKEDRNKTRIPQTLETLAIMTVAKHCTRFIDCPDSPLKYLCKWIKNTPGIWNYKNNKNICLQPIQWWCGFCL